MPVNDLLGTLLFLSMVLLIMETNEDLIFLSRVFTSYDF